MMTAETIDERRGATSASNAPADQLCPGRHLAQRGFARIESEDSKIGQRIHNALATGKLEGLDFSDKETVERCLEIERKKLVEFFGDEAGKAQCFREDPENPERSRIWGALPVNGKTLEHSCRTDVIYRAGDRALIFEYKTLAGDVPESPRNLQLRDQQCLVRSALLVTGDIGVCVIQPLVESDPPICVYTPADSKKAADQMWARVIASNDPNAPRSAGDIQCKFCLAKPRCMPYQQWAGTLVPAMLTVLEVPMADWTVEQRIAAANALAPAMKLLEDIKEFIRGGLEKDANFCPGWELKPGNNIETITDPQGVFDRFVKLGGNVEQFLKAIKVGKEKLREQLAQLTGAKGKALDKAMKTLTEGLVESRRNRPSLKKGNGDEL